jgi:protein-L-isoaspartate(D-aspartate) O-methyltransferase
MTDPVVVPGTNAMIPTSRSRLSLALLAFGMCAAVPSGGGAGDDATFARARQQMVERQLQDRDIRDPAVLRAMGKVPRHRFVAPGLAAQAYGDRALPIEEGQTISQPYIVALMTQLLELTGAETVLEVGTGSGYQAAILAEIVKRVYTIEILPGLATRAAERLRALGYSQVSVRAGDGYRGWPEVAPFDAIVVTAGATHIPEPLVAQLTEGGRLVIPVGGSWRTQELIQGRKRAGRLATRAIVPVRFVPLMEPRR